VSETTILAPELVLLPGQHRAASGLEIVVEAGRIVAIRPRRQGAAIELPGQMLISGAVNAHQHGRGITNFQHGFADERLETSLHARIGRGRLDPYAMTLLAAKRMIASGVTACVHGNVPYGSGDLAGEVDAMLRAYDDAGLRALVCVGAQDRAHVVYPEADEAAFEHSLPDDLRALVASRRKPPYAPDAEATIAAMDQLWPEWSGHARLSLGYGPSGPQWLSDGAFEALAKDAATRGAMLHYHCLESWTQRAACDRLYPEGVLARLRRLGALHDRVSLAHIVWLDEDDVAIAADAGVTLVRCAGSNLNLSVGQAPTAHYLAAGIEIAIGTDGRSIDDGEDIWREARLVWALARGDGWEAPPAPDAAAWLRALTSGGAKAGGFAHVGEIREGWRADLVAVNLAMLRGIYADPDSGEVELLAKRMTAEAVRLTMVEGRILYRDGAFLVPELERAEALAAASAQESKRTRNADAAAMADRLRPYLDAHYRRWVPPSPRLGAPLPRAHRAPALRKA
jgi:cytosine/adenosine deaminase-related metal-dependent hydrolase